MRIIFWCEFPEKVNWSEVKKLINFNSEIYVACKDKNSFLSLKDKIKIKNIDFGVWPILDLDEGYWFSGFLNETSIDKLDQFNGEKIKIDIEPPFPGRNKNPYLFLLKYLFLRGKNNKYLRKKIIELSKDSKIIVSGFPLPLFFRKRYGHFDCDGVEKSYIAYTTFFKSLKVYYSWFIKRELKKDKELIVGLGCVGKGIFGNEPVYGNLEEFKRDLELVKKLGVKSVVIFDISGLMDKEDRKDWIEVLEKYIGY